MTIIAESGATKTDWRAVTSDGNVISVETPGINVATSDKDYNESVLRDAVSRMSVDGDPVTRIYFYAAGLIPDGNPVPESAAGIDLIFRKSFPYAEIWYASDLLDAARALCGHEPGIAVILGTGSNSCEYDGERIVRNVRSGGFILGDEGGAARLGRMFVSDFMKGIVPEPLASSFSSSFEVDYQSIVSNVYRGSSPARYLGSFAPFICREYSRYDYVKDLVDSNFRDLFQRALSQYGSRKVGVVGGYAFAMKDVLLEVATSEGFEISEILPSPVDRLVQYHCPWAQMKTS